MSSARQKKRRRVGRSWSIRRILWVWGLGLVTIVVVSGVFRVMGIKADQVYALVWWIVQTVVTWALFGKDHPPEP